MTSLVIDFSWSHLGSPTGNCPNVLVDTPEVVAARADSAVAEPPTDRRFDLLRVVERSQDVAVSHAVGIARYLDVAVAAINAAAQDVARGDRRRKYKAHPGFHDACNPGNVLVEVCSLIDVVAGVAGEDVVKESIVEGDAAVAAHPGLNFDAESTHALDGASADIRGDVHAIHCHSKVEQQGHVSSVAASEIQYARALLDCHSRQAWIRSQATPTAEPPPLTQPRLPPP